MDMLGYIMGMIISNPQFSMLYSFTHTVYHLHCHPGFLGVDSVVLFGSDICCIAL
ncbi:hypothetical protein NC652_036989 [Populus alba x Populus x berolinensis]|nr:hypothetical protein NC652_036989 [Populus alba x Populus x berolinensis]